MGMVSRMLVPRSVRRAMHPVDNAVYGVQRSLNTRPRRSTGGASRSRSSSGGGSGFWAVVGVLFALALVWWALTWPWMLATSYEKRHGNPAGSSAYNTAGWTAEGAYLVVLVVLVVLAAVLLRRPKTRPTSAAPTTAPKTSVSGPPVVAGWYHAPSDPPALRRFFDGRTWTAQTQWDMSYGRPARPAPSVSRAQVVERFSPSGSAYYEHGSCLTRHRSTATAMRCRQG